MSEPTNHWKLGLFVVAGSMLLITVLVYWGSRNLNKEAVTYVSYFDEAVTGLEVGSPVRFRGVTVGKVSRIDVAPDHRHVEVGYDLVVSVLGRLGLATDRGEATRIAVPPDLRAQLGSSGVTGVKYVLIDFFIPKDHAPPKLSFPTPERYIPATPSTLKDIEESVVHAIDEFPKLAHDAEQVLANLNEVLSGLASQKVPERAVATLASADETLALMRDKLNELDAAQLSSDSHVALSQLNTTLLRAQTMMDRIDGEHGVLASMQRATDSIGDMAGSARGYGPELSDALRELRDAADSFRQLVDTLELQPDMLVKGRAKVKE